MHHSPKMFHFEKSKHILSPADYAALLQTTLSLAGGVKDHIFPAANKSPKHPLELVWKGPFTGGDRARAEAGGASHSVPPPGELCLPASPIRPEAILLVAKAFSNTLLASIVKNLVQEADVRQEPVMLSQPG